MARNFVLIADADGAFRSRLAALLRERQLPIAEIHEAAHFDAARVLLQALRGPGLAIFDLTLPGLTGPQALVALRGTHPVVRVALLSAIKDRALIAQTITLGLNGYIAKSLGDEAMVEGVCDILADAVHVPRMRALPLATTEPGLATQSWGQALPSITRRQRDVLDLVITGRSNKEIARCLGIAEGTVKIHLAGLFEVFKVRNRTELAMVARTAAEH